MAEAAFHKLQIGPQSTVGTAVAPTTVLPVAPGVTVALDRGHDEPVEDYGVLPLNMEGRGMYRLKRVEFPIVGALTFEQAHHLLEMSIAGGVMPTGTGPYVYGYTSDSDTNTTVPYTIESVDESQPFRAVGCFITALEMGFEVLEAGEAAPWEYEATVQAIDREQTAGTEGVTWPDELETLSATNTTASEGSTLTAFGSLDELEGIVSYSLRIEDTKPLRYYAGAEKASKVGRKRRKCTVSGIVKVSETALDNIEAVYNVAGSVPVERRWRITTTGSDGREFVIDHTLRFTDAYIDPDGREGERVLAFDAVVVGDLEIGITNNDLPPFLGVVDAGVNDETAGAVIWNESGNGFLDISASHANRALYAFVLYRDDVPSTPTVAWSRSGESDEPFTQIDIENSGVDVYPCMAVFRLLNPSAGVGSVTAWTGTRTGAFYLVGVGQSTPEAATATGTNTAASSAQSISIGTGDLILDAAGWIYFNSSGMADPTPGANQTSGWATWYDDLPGFDDLEFAGSYGTDETPTHTSVAVPGSGAGVPYWVTAAVSVKAA